jgi:nicotinamidase-related amidase
MEQLSVLDPCRGNEAPLEFTGKCWIVLRIPDEPRHVRADGVIDDVEANVHRLARAAAILDLPLIFTTSEEDGPNGPLLPSLKEAQPAAYEARIDRHGIIDSLADPAVAKAISTTGRRQLITAGIGTEVCGVAPALHAHRDGYEVTFVADACGSATALGHDVSLRRLEREGITLTTTASVIAELTREYPKYSQIMFG